MRATIFCLVVLFLFCFHEVNAHTVGFCWDSSGHKKGYVRVLQWIWSAHSTNALASEFGASHQSTQGFFFWSRSHDFADSDEVTLAADQKRRVHVSPTSARFAKTRQIISEFKQGSNNDVYTQFKNNKHKFAEWADFDCPALCDTNQDPANALYYEIPLCMFGAISSSRVAGIEIPSGGFEVETMSDRWGGCFVGGENVRFEFTIPGTTFNGACADHDRDGKCDHCNCFDCRGNGQPIGTGHYHSKCGNWIIDPNEECDSEIHDSLCENCRCAPGHVRNATTNHCSPEPCLARPDAYVHGGRVLKPHVKSCVSQNPGKRVITCDTDYEIYGKTPDTHTFTYNLDQTFTSCVEVNACEIGGIGNDGAHISGCVSNFATKKRTITCESGYYANANGNKVEPTETIGFRDNFAGCVDLNECDDAHGEYYGLSKKHPNDVVPATCTTPRPNVRSVTCNYGYKLASGATHADTTVVIEGKHKFEGCVDVNECVEAHVNPGTKVKSCLESGSRPIPSPKILPGWMKVTCQTGYHIVGLVPAGQQEQLVNDTFGQNPFSGCEDHNECDHANGPSPYAPADANLGANGKLNIDGTTPCEEPRPGVRLIRCALGFSPHQPHTQSREIVLESKAPFNGCHDINECDEQAFYGFSNRHENTLTCTATDPNSRVITCKPGYHALERVNPRRVGTEEVVRLEGNAKFDGCFDIDECVHYGIKDTNGQDQTTGVAPGKLKCQNLENERVITCLPGYSTSVSAVHQDIKLPSSSAFGGCHDLNECANYAYGSPPFTPSKGLEGCKQGPINHRNVTCSDGYAAVPPNIPWLMLRGNETFPGCEDIDECAVYQSNVKREPSILFCVAVDLNKRVIQCTAGYALPGTDNATTLELEGNAPFEKCIDINECQLYGAKAAPKFVKPGKDGCSQPKINTRTIFCQSGYYVNETNQPQIDITGADPFMGCYDFDECKVYQTPLVQSILKCDTPAVNMRRITCKPGYYAQGKTNPVINVTADAKFVDCMDVNECKEYGFSNNGEHAEKCVNTTINTREITCKKGYITVNNGKPSVILSGSDTFQGCVPWCGDNMKVPQEECDDGNLVNGDGCSDKCVVDRKNYICSTYKPGKCCEWQDVEEIKKEFGIFVECQNGSYRATVDPQTNSPQEKKRSIQALPPLTRLYPHNVTTQRNFDICGDFIIGVNDVVGRHYEDEDLRHRDPTLILKHNLTIRGSLRLEDTANIVFYPNSHIIILPTCELGWEDSKRRAFSMVGNGQISMKEFLWNADSGGEPMSPVIIEGGGCAVVDGNFFIDAIDIPHGGESFKVIKTNRLGNRKGCVVGDPQKTFHTVDHILPGACSRLAPWHDDENVFVQLNRKDLCSGWIVAIVLCSLLAVLLIAGIIGFFLFGASAGTPANVGTDGTYTHL